MGKILFPSVGFEVTQEPNMALASINTFSIQLSALPREKKVWLRRADGGGGTEKGKTVPTHRVLSAFLTIPSPLPHPCEALPPPFPTPTGETTKLFHPTVLECKAFVLESHSCGAASQGGCTAPAQWVGPGRMH